MNIYHAPLRYAVSALVVLGTCFVVDGVDCRAQSPDTGNDQGAEVLTRGPVHEAFAGVVTFNPVPGVVIPKAPPATIEEVPPDQKPEGDNFTWIPGYWAWDDERSDFLWVSGVWRALPPGRQWVPGYWVQSGTGYQWISGYWADARQAETTYLPAPPPTIEAGPNIAAPSADFYWTPGCWVWYGGRYAWRPGYWVAGQPEWVWCPAYYTWTPRGYVFVDGYWDYRVEQRGVLFAPVYYVSPVYVQPSYYYSPSVCINLTVFPEHLFIRPRYGHCYFGDYYAASYYRSGYYASFSYQSKHHGYDPICAQRLWDHRDDHGWDRQVATTYQYRRDHEDARPPRTWAAEKRLTAGAQSKDQSLAVASSFNQLTTQKNSPIRFQPVPKAEKQQIVQRDQQVRKTRDERRTLESNAVAAPNAKPGKTFQPSTAKLPQSPIVAPPSAQPGRDQTLIHPRPVSRPDTTSVPKREAATPDSNVNKNNRQPEPVRLGNRGNLIPTQPEVRPQVPPPVRREPTPPVEQPTRQAPPPQAQQPPKREAKPVQEKPAKENQGGNGKGDARNDHKGEDQQP